MSGTVARSTITSGRGLRITSGAADTYSAPSELFAAGSNTENVQDLRLDVRVEAGTNRNFKMQLVTDASLATDFGPEIPINEVSSQTASRIIVPLRLPSGTRFGVKIKDATGGGTLDIVVRGQTSDSLIPTGASTGVLLTDQGGSNGFLTLNTGAAANTWVGTAGNVSASTAADYNHLVVTGRDTSSGGVADGFVRVQVDGVDYIAPTYVRMTNGAGRQFSVFGEGLIPAGSEITIQFRVSDGNRDDLIAAVLAFNTTAQGVASGETKLVNGGLVG